MQQAHEHDSSSTKAAGRSAPANAEPRGVTQKVATMSLNGSTLQRKPGCACGGACPRCQAAKGMQAHTVQPKLTVNAPGDAFEQEADRVADHVMRMPAPGGATPASEAPGVAASSGTAPHVQRACAACGGGASQVEEEEGMMQAKESPGGTPRVSDATAGRISSMRGGGEPLDRSVRERLEPRFGHDFGNVRIHRDAGAAQAARDVSARAFTVGGDIAFASGEYAPHTSTGMRLLAHELTHTIQQGVGAPGDSNTLQRQVYDPMTQPQIDDPRDPETTSAPKGKTWSGAPARCGPSFCRPLPTQRLAEHDRESLWPILSLGIAVKVSPRVLGIWSEWAFGGGGVRDLSGKFGDDFRDSKTTAATTTFLMGELKKELTARPPAIASPGFKLLDLKTLIPTAIKAIDTSGGANEMNFNQIGEIPGNIAGGIGKDQAANPVGATPSPQDDERIAKGMVLVLNPGRGDLTVIPSISYTVKDTVDLCPGDCGAKKEQIATIPMSQWEATGISGDVPYTVDFPAAALPFTVPAKP
ncbi:MAG TPA: DUF4157 domain-containing protein [Candidatus Kapabacteria bacterium]|nr:DUF4157 domain-containing protein [Candidatus Kapabacteria bacterium]